MQSLRVGAATPGVPCQAGAAAPTPKAVGRIDGTRPLINQGRGWPAKVGQLCDTELFGALALLMERPNDARVIHGCRAARPAGTVERLVDATPRQREPEQRAAAGGVLDRDRAAVRLGDLAHDRQAE